MPKIYTIEELKLTPDQTAFASENVELAFKLVSVWRRKYPFTPYDDIYDTVIHAFIKAVRTYDEDKGKFSTYNYYVTEREIQKYFRDINRAKRKAFVYSLDDEVGTLSDRNLSFHEILGESDDYIFEDVDWISRASQSLTDREKHLIQLTIVQGIGQREAGRIVGISQMQVSRIVKQGLEKMRKYAERVS